MLSKSEYRTEDNQEKRVFLQGSGSAGPYLWIPDTALFFSYLQEVSVFFPSFPFYLQKVYLHQSLTITIY
jgi:hypothetical protein